MTRRADRADGWLVEGILLHMPGRWEASVDVAVDGEIERAQWTIGHRAMTPRRRHRSWIPLRTAILAIVDAGSRDAGHGRLRPVSAPSEAEKEGSRAAVSAVGLDPDVQRRAMASSPLPVPPADPTNRWADDREAAALGRRMFFDSRLSADGSVSCATCHQPERRFTDGLPRSRGIGAAARHAPSLVDAAHHRWFNWDGRSDSMWAHAIRPIENPLEMGGDRTAVVRTVLEDPELRAEYETIFGPLEFVAESLPARARPQGDDAATDAWASMGDEDRRAVGEVVANLGKAMAAYQRTLRSEPSTLRCGGSPTMSRAAGRRLGMHLRTPRNSGGCRSSSGVRSAGSVIRGRSSATGSSTTSGFPSPNGLPRDPGRYDGSLLVREDPFNAAGPSQ